MGILIISILVLVLGAILNIFVKEDYKLKLTSVAVFVSAILSSISALKVLVTNSSYNEFVLPSNIFGALQIGIDPLSAIFILIVSIMSFVGVVYANGYMKPYLHKEMNISSHCFFLQLLIASMLAVTVARNGLFFLIVWEIMSLSSFFLVLFEGEKKEVRKAGIKYLIYMHLSVIFIIAMFALLTNASGSFSFDSYKEVLLQNQQFADIIFTLAFIGFGVKAGFVPFHNWLPDAHPAAPSHVSGIMSGVMIKTGIYGILRIVQMLGVPSKFASYLLLTVAVISALYGVLYAITQHDIKRLLAYHSIENIGIIGIGIGVGMLGLAYSNPIVATLGFAGGILHVLNHSIFKELLFFAAGSTYLKTHTRNIESLGGLIKKMPSTALMFIIGSIAISGLPPFNGFVSEFLIYAGMLLGIPSSEINLFLTLVISIAALALVGTMAILCFSKASGVMFLGEARSENAKQVDSDVGKVMLIPMGLLAFATFFIGVFPQYVINIVLTPAMSIIKGDINSELFNHIVALTQVISCCFFIFLIVLLILYSIRKLIDKDSKEHTTWGCGYDRPNSHMQYTASSYANLFVSTLKPLFKRVSHIKKPKELFPKDAYFELEIEDIEEAYIVEPIIKFDEKILAKFERIQNGNMQQYILFGLIFLIVMIIGLVLFGG